VRGEKKKSIKNKEVEKEGEKHLFLPLALFIYNWEG